MARPKSFIKRQVRKIPAGFRQKAVGTVAKVTRNPYFQAIAPSVASAVVGAGSDAVAPGSSAITAPAAYVGTRYAVNKTSAWSTRQHQKIAAKRRQQKSY
jgi:hypothetical protein